MSVCERCHRPAELYAPDPFIAEVYPEDQPKPAWWCWACFENRKDDV
jgi:hypothetical protein